MIFYFFKRAWSRLQTIFPPRPPVDIYSRPPLVGLKAILKAKIKTEREFVTDFLMDHPGWSPKSSGIRSLAIDRQIEKEDELWNLYEELVQVEGEDEK